MPYLVTLTGPARRREAHRLIDAAPDDARVTVDGPKRSLEQNKAMWSALSDVARQKHHHNLKLAPEDWRLIFLSGLDHEMRLVPNLEGNGVVQLGRSTSKLSKRDFSDLLDLIYAWGALNDVEFTDPKSPLEAPAAAAVGAGAIRHA